MIYLASYESEFCFKLQIILKKRERGFCLENATKFHIQDMFENGKPDIILKMVKRFDIKITPK